MLHIVHAITHASGSTVAAWVAAVIAVWVARSQTRERAQMLGRQTVIDVNTAAASWSIEASRFVGHVLHLSQQPDVSPVAPTGAEMERFIAATTETDEALKTARLMCNNFELQKHIAEVEMQIGSLLASLQLPAAARISETPRERLTRIFVTGTRSLDGFGEATESFLSHGFKIYSPRRSIRYRIANWRFQREVEQSEAALRRHSSADTA